MDNHFRAFSFVDRIISIQDGSHIYGSYTIPSGIQEFPLSIVGEAVGQLAAWAAMAASGFRQRPVAGLASRIELEREVRPGELLQLSADLENLDAESAHYSGTAKVNGATVARLTDCVGPMMPVEDFDDPEALRGRLDRLRGPGSQNDGFPGLPQLQAARTGGEAGKYVAARFQVPAKAPLFADHFPRRAVFPGSLLMHVSLQVATSLASEIPVPTHGVWVPASIQDMKLRSFIPPGASLQLQARLRQRTDDLSSIAIETRSGNEVIATARLLLKPGGRV